MAEKKVYFKWTSDRIKKMQMMLTDCFTAQEIAKALGTTVDSVRWKMKVVGVSRWYTEHCLCDRGKYWLKEDFEQLTFSSLDKCKAKAGECHDYTIEYSIHYSVYHPDDVRVQFTLSTAKNADVRKQLDERKYGSHCIEACSNDIIDMVNADLQRLFFRSENPAGEIYVSRKKMEEVANGRNDRH